MNRYCLICNKKFRVKPSKIKAGRGKYCSREHADKGRTVQVSYNCAVCNLAFKIPLSESRRKNRQWCSNKCRYSVPENNPNWQGGITKWYSKIRNSNKYRAWRLSVLRKDYFTCQGCGVQGGVLEADHIKPFSLYPDLRFSLLNGQALCKPCHDLKTIEDRLLILEKKFDNKGPFANLLVNYIR